MVRGVPVQLLGLASHSGNSEHRAHRLVGHAKIPCNTPETFASCSFDYLCPAFLRDTTRLASTRITSGANSLLRLQRASGVEDRY